MYKAIGIIFCAILVLFCSPNGDFLASFSEFSGGKVYFCTNSVCDLVETVTVKNGKGYIISADTKLARKVQNTISKADLEGIAVRYDGQFDCEKYLRKISAKVLYEEVACEYAYVYAYSPKFSRSVTYKGQKINVQIAKTGDTTTIGYPLILIGA